MAYKKTLLFSPAVYRVVNMPNELGFEEQITKNLKDNRLNQPQSFITGIDLEGPSLQPRVPTIFNFPFFSIILAHSVFALSAEATHKENQCLCVMVIFGMWKYLQQKDPKDIIFFQ